MEWRKKKRDIFSPFSFEDLFRDIFESMRIFEEEIERLFEEIERQAKEGRGFVRTIGPYYYGVRITIGPDGIPRVEEFGNIRRTEEGRRILSEEIEPLVDVIEDEDEVWIIAELPGVSKDKIKVKIKDNKVIIKASNGKKYYKEVELPTEVEPKTAKARYNNGVLEVRVKKKGATEKEEERTEVKVE